MFCAGENDSDLSWICPSSYLPQEMCKEDKELTSS